MSMSLVFDSVWRWRKNFTNSRPPQGTCFRLSRYSLTTVARFFGVNGQTRPPDPTLPVSGIANQDSLTATTLSSSTPTPAIPGMAGMPTGIADDFITDPYGASSYEVFDPMNWLLDGTVDFPFNFQSTTGSDTTKYLSTDI